MGKFLRRLEFCIPIEGIINYDDENILKVRILYCITIERGRKGVLIFEEISNNFSRRKRRILRKLEFSIVFRLKEGEGE